jgi:hypothetical protein
MAALKAELKRAFLQSIYDAYKAETLLADLTGDTDGPAIVTFEDALKAFQHYCFGNVKDGKTLFHTAGLGHETRWALPMQWRSFSEDEVFSMGQEFREVHNEAIVTLADAGNIHPNDSAILSTMMANDRMQTVTDTQRDFTLLRWSHRF